MARNNKYLEYKSMWSSYHISDMAPINAFAAAILFATSWSSRRENKIQSPRYLKCLQKVTNPSQTTISFVSRRSSYSVSALLCLDSYDSRLVFSLGTNKLLLLIPLSADIMHFRLKNPGGGKKTHSVLEAFFPLPTCISRPDRVQGSLWNKSSI